MDMQKNQQEFARSIIQRAKNRSNPELDLIQEQKDKLFFGMMSHLLQEIESCNFAKRHYEITFCGIAFKHKGPEVGNQKSGKIILDEKLSHQDFLAIISATTKLINSLPNYSANQHYYKDSIVVVEVSVDF